MPVDDVAAISPTVYTNPLFAADLETDLESGQGNLEMGLNVGTSSLPAAEDIKE